MGKGGPEVSLEAVGRDGISNVRKGEFWRLKGKVGRSIGIENAVGIRILKKIEKRCKRGRNPNQI